MADDDALREAQGELENAYRLFNAASDPRLIDEAILRIRSAEMRLDYLTHPLMPAPQALAPLPWLQDEAPQA